LVGLIAASSVACDSTSSTGKVVSTSTTTTSPAPRPADGWRHLTDAPLRPRLFPSMFWTGEEVLVMGGLTGPPCLPYADCGSAGETLLDGAAFDPARETWRTIRSMPSFGFAPSVVARGDVYFLAAAPDGSSASTLHRYDVERDRWTESPGPESRGNRWVGLVAAGDHLVAYLTSQEAGDAREVAMDLDTGDWTTLPPDPFPLSRDRTMTWTGDELVLTAIEGSPSEGPNVYRAAAYDFGAESWRRLPDSGVLGWDFVWHWLDGRLVNPTLGSIPAGRNGWDRDYPFGGILDVEDGTWSSLPAPPAFEGRDDLFSGLTAGGQDVAVNSLGWVFDARRDRWIALPRPAGAPTQDHAGVWTDDGLVVHGGARFDDADGTVLGDTWLWVPPP
jgi:hypothetical protein